MAPYSTFLLSTVSWLPEKLNCHSVIVTSQLAVFLLCSLIVKHLKSCSMVNTCLFLHTELFSQRGTCQLWLASETCWHCSIEHVLSHLYASLFANLQCNKKPHGSPLFEKNCRLAVAGSYPPLHVYSDAKVVYFIIVYLGLLYDPFCVFYFLFPWGHLTYNISPQLIGVTL
jgi:hypothetical protein